VSAAPVVAPAEAVSPLVLTIDIGSSSARAALFDGRAHPVAGVGAQERYELLAGPAGAAELDPDALVEHAARCVDQALAQAGPLAGRIGAVAVATLATSTLALDRGGRPLTPLITYADTRADADAAGLRGALDEAAVHERTGCLLRASYWPARLAWARRALPDLWRAAAAWVTLGEYLELRLLGVRRVSLSAASWTGLLDRRLGIWDAELLRTLRADPGLLAPLVDCDEPRRGLAPPFAARWPALRDAPWFPAVGDGAAANLGSGCIGHKRVALTVGTTGALRVAQAEVARVPHGLWCYRVDRDHALVGGATSEGGNVYAWLRDTLNLGDPAAIEAAIAAQAPDGHGLTVLPFLAGERSPGWAGNVRATIHGLSTATTPIAILRASLEAVALRFALIERALRGEQDTDHRLIASGGALLSSPAWMQICADAIGRPVVASAEPEATSRGAAILALRALGAVPALDALPAADGPTLAPDPARHAIYQEAMARQRQLYAQLIPGD